MVHTTIATKGLFVGVILLLQTIGFSPITVADDTTNTQAIDTVPLTILEYNADGTVERSVVKLTSEQVDVFCKDIQNAQDLDTRLSIYKKYHLLLEDVTVDMFWKGMRENAQRRGIANDDLLPFIRTNRSLFPIHVHRNFCCSISGYTFGGTPILIPFGTKWLVSLFGREARVFEAFDVILGELPISSKGLFGEFDCYSIALKMVGFVGVMYYFWHNFYGFTMDGFCAYFKSLAIY